MKIPIGQILIQSGIITSKTLERALARQQGCGKRLGAVLMEMGVLTQEELIDALAQQSGFGTVKGIAERHFPSNLLDLIPEEMALHKVVFPLLRQDGVLQLAVTDPFDTDTIEFLEQQHATTIVPVLATREDILDAVNRHYLGGGAAGNGGVKILVVDASPEVNAEIECALRKEGYQVLTACDGVEGLRIAFSQNPDLILCDAAMPRMDGYALMRAIKANPNTAQTPMILITSKTSQEEEHRALKSGFHDFIAKPMMTVRVVSRVKRALEMMQQCKERHFTAAP